MRICEEYFQRNQISDVPIIHCPNKGALLLLPSGNYPWSILNFYWEEQTAPGNYVFTREYAVHNGYKDGRLFGQKIIEKVSWNEYENYIWEFISPYRDFRDSSIIVPVQGLYKTVTINAWEMFVYQCDDLFSEQKTQFKSLLFETLDTDKSIVERYANYEFMCRYLEEYLPVLLKKWKFEVLMRLQKYSHWLADLICQNLRNPILRLTNEG